MDYGHLADFARRSQYAASVSSRRPPIYSNSHRLIVLLYIRICCRASADLGRLQRYTHAKAAHRKAMLCTVRMRSLRNLRHVQHVQLIANYMCDSSQTTGMLAAGAPFELSKRKRMTLFLSCRLANLALETIMTGELATCTLLQRVYQRCVLTSLFPLQHMGHMSYLAHILGARRTRR